MANLTQAQATYYLRYLGFRIRTTAEYKQVVRNFQQAWNLGAALNIDGVMGPDTSAALRTSVARKRAGKPDLSAHFSFHEFACKCGGRYSNCMRIKILRIQVQRCERYRMYAGSFTPISGYRCPSYNASVGGARNSQHMYGAAVDVPRVLSHSRVRGLRLFAGIGYARSTGRVAHVDSRDRAGHNTTGGSTSRPTVWVYAS